MIIYLRTGGKLKDMLKPDVDEYTRKVEVESGKNLKEILHSIGVNPAYIAYAYIDGKIKMMDYIPSDGEKITLQPPVSGG
jgi:molybdopterin converting factor small subunit